jgi:SAM-dependent methyltransferase
MKKDTALSVEEIYTHRFRGSETHRQKVWSVLARYFQRWVRPTDTVLDLGAGYCEFINNIHAKEKLALDLNPITSAKASGDVRVVAQDVCQSWAISSGSIDVVFTSNFFEHLPSKEDLKHCFNEIHRVLRPGGILIAMGPNIRFCFNIYWDFLDHYLPLSDRSMTEAIELAELRTEEVIPRFLPYTMSRKNPPSLFLIWLYLRMPLFWRILGKQFLVVARKANVPAS